jgi:DNA processing protein
MVEQGALLTEFTSRDEPDKNNFVKRNRIIAGLADATVVVESDARGGGLITADIAHSYNRDVFAVPGRTVDRYSSGCNFLIKSNRAAMLEGAGDLEYIMGWEKAENSSQAIQTELFSGLSGEEKSILTLLTEGDRTIDEISTTVKIPISKLSPLLLNLEFRGLVASLPGMVYRMRNTPML